MKESYALRWAEYRLIRKCGMVALIAFLATPFVIIPIFGWLLRFSAFHFLTRLAMVPFLIEAALLFAAGYFAWKQYTWQCPRCGEPFGRLHEECRNCGLPKWANQIDSELGGDGAVSSSRI